MQVYACLDSSYKLCAGISVRSDICRFYAGQSKMAHVLGQLIFTGLCQGRSTYSWPLSDRTVNLQAVRRAVWPLRNTAEGSGIHATYAVVAARHKTYDEHAHLDS